MQAELILDLLLYLSKDRNSPVIENFKQSAMPGLKEEVSKEEFLKLW